LPALLFAAHEAQRRGAVLEIVTAHDLGVPTFGYVGGFGGGFAMETIREDLEASVKAAADTVAVALAGAPIHVRTVVVQGRPSRVLLDAAKGAVLLVVGARGAGALSRLVLGSTSTEVVHAAHLPVTVVPSDLSDAS
ncbi:MAG: universal stress protein family, partial [Frankiales bacterium]|nr:universal stress protein family [Frankiales bacterium]